MKNLKPLWLSKEWREGSAGAAEKRSTLRFVIGGSIAFALVLSMLWFNLFDTYLYQSYAKAGGIAHLFSWIFGISSIYALWKTPDFSGEVKGWILGLVALGGLALSIMTGSGFNFSI